MAVNSGNSIFNQSTRKNASAGYSDEGNGGGNSGCVISPASGLGLSAYQNPKIPVKTLPKRQGGS